LHSFLKDFLLLQVLFLI